MNSIQLLFLFSTRLLRKRISNFKKNYKVFCYSYVNNCNIELDANLTGDFTRLQIGEGTTINSQANFRFGEGRISIGKNCLFARNVTIITQSYEVDKQQLVSPKFMYVKDVFIGNGVWIGGNVVIMPGVTIDDNVIIGAGSIVTKDIHKNEIWAGVPAKLIRQRNIVDGK